MAVQKEELEKDSGMEESMGTSPHSETQLQQEGKPPLHCSHLRQKLKILPLQIPVWNSCHLFLSPSSAWRVGVKSGLIANCGSRCHFNVLKLPLKANTAFLEKVFTCICIYWLSSACVSVLASSGRGWSHICLCKCSTCVVWGQLVVFVLWMALWALCTSEFHYFFNLNEKDHKLLGGAYLLLPIKDNKSQYNWVTVFVC